MQSPAPPGAALGSPHSSSPHPCLKFHPLLFFSLLEANGGQLQGPQVLGGYLSEQGAGQQGSVGTAVGGFTVLQESGPAATSKREIWILLEICGKLFQTP